MAKEPCSFVGEVDGHGCLPVSALTSVGRDCTIPAGTCFTFPYERVDEHGHVVDRDDPAAFKCLHHPHKEKFMSKTPAAPTVKEDLVDAALAQENTPDDADLPPEEAEEQPPPLPTTAPAPLAHKSLVEVPSAPPTAIGEVKSLVGADGGSIITVLLAAIGVLGGGAGWKFYQSFAKQRHAERMKQLEIEATRVEKVEAVKAEIAAENAEARREQKDDNHQKCSAERLALESKVTALEARLADAEKAAQEAAEAAKAANDAAAAAKQEAGAAKQVDPELPFNAEDFEGVKERLEQIEKALKKASPKEKEKPKKAAKKND